MKSLSAQHKKGVSEIVSYTLLIIIAIGASILVYSLLMKLIPKPEITCPSDVNLIIKHSSCSFASQELNLTFLNKGRFSVFAAYIRVGNVSRDTRVWINNDEHVNFYFGSLTKGLVPNEETTWSLNLSAFPANATILNDGSYALEVQPAMWDPNLKKTAVCEAIVKQTLDC